MTSANFSKVVEALNPGDTGQGSTIMKIGGEKFFLSPEFLDVVPVGDVYRVLQHLEASHRKPTSTAANFRDMYSEAYNPFGTIEDYRNHMSEIFKQRALAADFEYEELGFQKPFVDELTAYFGGFHGDPGMKYLKPEKKVILVLGGLGLGKTFFLRSFAKNPYQSYVFVRAKELEEMVRNGKYEQFQKEVYNWQCPQSPSQYYGQNKLALFVDDIGTEETEAKSYGNTNNVIQMIIEHRYEQFRYRKGLNLILSTNLTFTQLEENYGARAFDRLMEIACVYVMPKHESLRQVKKTK